MTKKNNADQDVVEIDIDNEIAILKNKIFESGKSMAEIMIPALSNTNFNTFIENLKNKKYKEIYTSNVFQAIKALCNGKQDEYLKADTKVFRARIVKDIEDIYQEKDGIKFDGDVIHGYDWYNSKEPPVGIACEGRANSQFSSYLYCANEPTTAASEIKANIGDYISLASFIIKRDLRIIRLEKKNFFEGKTPEECYQIFIANHFSTPVSDSQEYKLTQFISDELRKHGIDGICYKSHFTNADNYVIFNCSMENIEFFKSKILRLHSQQLNFIDFSSVKMLQTKPIPNLNNKEITNEKQYLYAVNQSRKDEKFWSTGTDDKK